MLKNWKTTLAGLVAGAGVAGNAILDAAQQGAFTGKHGMALVFAAGIIAIGAYSKDHDKTGV